MFKVRGYGFLTALYLLTSLLVTKAFYPRCRLIRLPFFFRIIGVFKGGKGLTTGVGCRFDVLSNAELHIGNGVQINDYVHIACAGRVSIGANALLASRVYISDHDHDVEAEPGNQGTKLIISTTVIGENCWLGEGVAVLKGVTLGNNCVVGANAVVTKSFPPFSILGGVPAKLIRSAS
jgi:lipopolysaccharide O-acetyltransferase